MKGSMCWCSLETLFQKSKVMVCVSMSFYMLIQLSIYARLSPIRFVVHLHIFIQSIYLLTHLHTHIFARVLNWKHIKYHTIHWLCANARMCLHKFDTNICKENTIPDTVSLLQCWWQSYTSIMQSICLEISRCRKQHANKHSRFLKP